MMVLSGCILSCSTPTLSVAEIKAQVHAQVFVSDSKNNFNIDFDCYTLHVSGDDIEPNSAIEENCSLEGDVPHKQFGHFTQPVRKGQAIDVDLIQGANRTLEIYGIYPSLPECGGTQNFSGESTAYLLGKLNMTVPAVQNADLTITVPSLFSTSQTSVLRCR